MATLLGAGIELPRAWLYEHLDIPMPQPDEPTIGKPQPAPPPSPFALGKHPVSGSAAGTQPASSDAIAAARAKALAEAYRGALAPVREIILRSKSPEEAFVEARRFFADWSPSRVAALIEEAMQIAAAAGAAAATDKTKPE